ncbi:MAG: hypothetical protein IKB02_09970 [Clostridia bacterium]|nr:hypothetical protein [Clostridia bacterium]MBR2389060.1 hypothetical protein [Clostridia bacterium]
MAKKGYVGIDNVARKVTKQYIGVDNVARKVTKGYIGVDNVARQCYAGGTPVGELEVGSSVYMNVNGVATEFLVVHQGNPDTTMYDVSCDGTWLLMKDIYENRVWNGGGGDTYAESDIHKYLNNEFLNLFDNDTSIKQVKIPYNSGYSKYDVNNTGANGLSTRIFLLSIREIGFDEYYSDYSPKDGVRLAYFDDVTKAYIGEFWWTRSPYVDDLNGLYVWRIAKQYPNDHPYTWYAFGVRPALILSNEATFDDNFNIN